MINSLSKWLLSGLLCFVSIYTSHAQANADSLKAIFSDGTLSDSIRFSAFNAYYKSFTHSNPDSTIKVSEIHLRFAEERNDMLEMSKAYNDRSYAYYLKEDTKQSMLSLEKSIAILEQLDVPMTLATVYSNIGNIYGEEGKYELALEFFYKTLKIFEDNDIRKGEARIHNNLGLVYYLIDSYDLAVDHYTKSHIIYNELGLEKKSGLILADLAAINLKKGEYEEAINKAESTIQLYIQDNDKYSLSDAYFTMAQSYHELGDKENARSYINKCLEIDRQLPNQTRLIKRLIFEAELDLATDLSLATEKAEDILDLLKDNSKIEVKASLYELLYKCYKSQSKFDLSLAMHEKSVLYNDSLELQKNQTSIVRDAVQKEYENKLLETQIKSEKTEANLRGSHQKKIALLSLFSLLLVLLVGLYSRSKIRANQKEKLQLLEEIERLKEADVNTKLIPGASKYALDRVKIEESIARSLNETDWKVLNILLDDPVIMNKEIAEKAFMSVDGIGSSLRRMYDYFEVKNTKYKKISLLMKAIKISNI